MARPAYKALQEEAYDHLREKIMNGELSYQTIYSESKMAADLGISRTPLRDAVHRLFQENLIDIIPNKGFTLHRITEKDVLEVYEVRSAIEGYCAFKAARELDTENVQTLLAELDDSMEKMRTIRDTTHDAVAFAMEDERFHTLLIEHSNNDHFQQIFHSILYQVRKLAEYTLAKEGRMDTTLAEHQEIIDAIRGGHSKGSYNAVMEHMTVPLKLNMESVYESDEG